MPSVVKSRPSVCAAPAAVSSATSPAARWPNRKFAPTTTAAACSRSTRIRSTNSSGDQPATSVVNGRARTASAPASWSSAARSPIDVSVIGAWSGRSTAIGCGSKVTATTWRPRSSAISRARAITRRCPRWTPSKFPITTTLRPRSAGTSPVARQICTVGRLSAGRSDEDGDGPGPAVARLVEREELPRRVEHGRQARQVEVEGTADTDVGGLLVGRARRPGSRRARPRRGAARRSPRRGRPACAPRRGRTDRRPCGAGR